MSFGAQNTKKKSAISYTNMIYNTITNHWNQSTILRPKSICQEDKNSLGSIFQGFPVNTLTYRYYVATCF